MTRLTNVNNPHESRLFSDGDRIPMKSGGCQRNFVVDEDIHECVF